MAAREGSQRWVAEQLGVSRRTVRYVEERAKAQLRGEVRTVNRCRRCGERGHTRRTCRSI
jgi:DNA-binding CsgD family transcriptional regulator